MSSRTVHRIAEQGAPERGARAHKPKRNAVSTVLWTAIKTAKGTPKDPFLKRAYGGYAAYTIWTRSASTTG